MNLSPEWSCVLARHGFQAVHWSQIGDPTATDEEILAWARSNNHIILTHDLDFGSIIAAANTQYPSVLQIRTLDVNPYHIGDYIAAVLARFKTELQEGALITVDKSRSRARILPSRHEPS